MLLYLPQGKRGRLRVELMIYLTQGTPILIWWSSILDILIMVHKAENTSTVGGRIANLFRICTRTFWANVRLQDGRLHCPLHWIRYQALTLLCFSSPPP